VGVSISGLEMALASTALVLPRRTLQRRLDQLIEAGVIRPIGGGRSIIYAEARGAATPEVERDNIVPLSIFGLRSLELCAPAHRFAHAGWLRPRISGTVSAESGSLLDA